MSWFHKYLFHYRCRLHHPCYPSTSIFMHYRTPWSLTSTTKCNILSIITGWLSWYLAHVDWIGIQFNNESLDMFVCTLSQSSLMSNWFTNRSQIWMIIIRCRRTCPAFLIVNLTWMSNWSSTRMSTGPGSTVELDVLSSEDVGQKWKLVANAQRVSSQTLVFIPIYYHNMTRKTVSN